MTNKTKILKRAVVKEELVALTKDLESALILNQFIYWSARINDFDKFISEEQSRREKETFNDVNVEYQNGWIYKDMEELKEELMFNSSVTTIGRRIDKLLKGGWISRRRNPKYKWDNTYQYRVNLIKISFDLFELGYILQDYKVNVLELLNLSNLQNECSDLQNECSNNQKVKPLKTSNLQNEDIEIQNEDIEIQNEGTIPKITTEITSDITSNNQTSEKEKLDKIKKPKIDGLIDLDKQLISSGFKTYKELVDYIGLEKNNFEYPYADWINCISKAIYEMYTYEYTKIRKRKLGRYDVISKLQGISRDIVISTIDSAIESSKEQQITYPTAFVKSILFNEIDEYSAKIQTQVNYNLENYSFS